MQLRQRGDTLVEVLLATAVLALIISGTAYVMSTGLAKSQLSLERTQVQASVAGQASVLRALREAAIKKRSPEAVSLWRQVGDYAKTPNSQLQQAVCHPASPANDKRFYFYDGADSVSNWLQPQEFEATATQKADIVPKSGFLPTAGDGLWIEAYYYPTSNPSQLAYYDFYIKACWDGSGSLGEQEVKSVVRLYANI